MGPTRCTKTSFPRRPRSSGRRKHVKVMPTCRICLHSYKRLKYETKDIAICKRCVSVLNESPEPAKFALERWTEKLANGMRRNAEKDLLSDDLWRQKKAQRILADVEAAARDALDGWLTKLLKNPSNSSRDFRLIRAYRRGLLRMDGYTSRNRNWEEVARQIRLRDNYKCAACGATDTILDVHHIVYLSHHGTNQKHNLVTLCRACHEQEHGRIFDLAETEDCAPDSPIEYEEGLSPPTEAHQQSTAEILDRKNRTTTEREKTTNLPRANVVPAQRNPTLIAEPSSFDSNRAVPPFAHQGHHSAQPEPSHLFSRKTAPIPTQNANAPAPKGESPLPPPALSQRALGKKPSSRGMSWLIFAIIIVLMLIAMLRA